jgi:hypothetical protein
MLPEFWAWACFQSKAQSQFDQKQADELAEDIKESFTLGL